MWARRLAALVLACIALPRACALGAGAGDALVWQQNGYAVASDGQDVYFFTTRGGRWSMHSALRYLAGEPPVFDLPEGIQPYGLLYAGDGAVWYARYSQSRRFEQEGELHAALEFVRYALDSGAESVLVADADPNALFLMDGHTLGYLPWQDECSLATADFVARTDVLTLQIDDSLIWDAAMADGALYLLLYNEETDQELLYRVTGSAAEKLPAPEPMPDVSWLQGRFRVYVAADGVFYATPLSDPSRGHPLPKGGHRGDVYYFGDYRWLCEVEAGNVARLYRIPLGEGEQIQYLEHDALSQTFVRGADGEEMITLDRRGRLLSISDDFSTLTQVAQLEYTTLFSHGEWLWALPFEGFVVMLGYSDAYNPPLGLDYPPDMVRVVRRGEGLAPAPPGADATDSAGQRRNPAQ